jgi:hypothetical protein
VADRADRTDMLRNRGLRGYGEWRKRVTGACVSVSASARERERERGFRSSSSFPRPYRPTPIRLVGFVGSGRLRMVPWWDQSLLITRFWGRTGGAGTAWRGYLPGAVALFGSPGGVHTSVALCSSPRTLLPVPDAPYGTE